VAEKENFEADFCWYGVIPTAFTEEFGGEVSITQILHVPGRQNAVERNIAAISQ
jgi:hypothetical protein